MCAACVGPTFVHVAPFCVNNMSKCSSQGDLHDGLVCIHATVHIDVLMFVAKLLTDINCWNLLIVNIMHASCDCYNLICTCSAFHVLHVGVL